MNENIESKAVVKISEAARKIENPMQERYCEPVAESVELTAEVIFTARMLDAREEAGPAFVP
jgi:hypothetical protein